MQDWQFVQRLLPLLMRSFEDSMSAMRLGMSHTGVNRSDAGGSIAMCVSALDLKCPRWRSPIRRPA